MQRTAMALVALTLALVNTVVAQVQTTVKPLVQLLELTSDNINMQLRAKSGWIIVVVYDPNQRNPDAAAAAASLVQSYPTRYSAFALNRKTQLPLVKQFCGSMPANQAEIDLIGLPANEQQRHIWLCPSKAAATSKEGLMDLIIHSQEGFIRAAVNPNLLNRSLEQMTQDNCGKILSTNHGALYVVVTSRKTPEAKQISVQLLIAANNKDLTSSTTVKFFEIDADASANAPLVQQFVGNVPPFSLTIEKQLYSASTGQALRNRQYIISPIQLLLPFQIQNWFSQTVDRPLTVKAPPSLVY